MELKGEDLVVCRGCLNTSGPMKSLTKEPLKDLFTQITNIIIYQENTFCWLCQRCVSLFKKIDSFKKNALVIDELLVQNLDVQNILSRTNETHYLSVINCTVLSVNCKEPKCDDGFGDSREITCNTGTLVSVGESSKSVKCLKYSAQSTKKICKKESASDTSEEIKEEKKSHTIAGIKKKAKAKRDTSKLLDLSKVTIVNLNKEEQLKEMDERRNSQRFIATKYKCHMCLKLFQCEENLQNHMKKHETKCGSFECDICHLRFSTRGILNGHLVVHSRRYLCRVCNHTLNCRLTMFHHILRHENIFKCRLCEFQSKNKSLYFLHKKSHSNVEEFKCEVCSKVFTKKLYFQTHMRSHTGDFPYPCGECGKSFRSFAALTAHKTAHSSDQNFYCASCDVTFKSHLTLKEHLKSSSKHIDPKSLNFQCESCPKRFKTDELRTAHVNSYHLRHKRYACDACPSRFVSFGGLRNHRRRIHEGLKPKLTYVCETCGHKFRDKVQLNNHIRVHTGEKPFECETCHQRFKQKATMATHVKLVHLKIKRNTAPR